MIRGFQSRCSILKGSRGGGFLRFPFDELNHVGSYPIKAPTHVNEAYEKQGYAASQRV
jgi:hypothetical protein